MDYIPTEEKICSLNKETEDLMKTRDKLKEEGLELVTEGRDLVCIEYKKLRSQVYNRRKFEEINFKQEEIKYQPSGEGGVR